MAVVEIEHLEDLLARDARLMGLDLGTKTVGIALSDVGRSIASPLETVKRVKFTQDAERLEALIDAHGVGALVFGLPISMDGHEGPRCQSTRQFAANMLARRDIPIAFWDERLSTAAIQRMLISEHDISRKRRAEVVDKAAAAYILQGAIDAIAARARAGA